MVIGICLGREELDGHHGALQSLPHVVTSRQTV